MVHSGSVATANIAARKLLACDVLEIGDRLIRSSDENETLAAMSAFRLLSLEECSAFLASAEESAAWISAGITLPDGRNVVRSKMRSAKCLLELDDPACFREIRATLSARLKRVIDEGYHLIGLNIVRYEPGGFYVPHTDSEATICPYRIFTVVCTLKSDHQGGHTAFPKLQWKFRGTPGVALMFPSRYLHGAMPVLDGEKWILQFYFGNEATPKHLRAFAD